MATRLAKGTSVVSLADGANLGSVDRVFLDPERRAIVGFTFHSGGFFGGKTTYMVDVTDIHAIGPDAVTLRDASSVRGEVAIQTRCEGLIDLDALLKRQVMTEGGHLVGQVTAIEFEQDSYDLQRIEVTPSAPQPAETIAATRIAHIGSDLIVVADPPAVVAPTAARRSFVSLASVA